MANDAGALLRNVLGAARIAADPRAAVARVWRRPEASWRLLAVGKGAASMASAVLDAGASGMIEGLCLAPPGAGAGEWTTKGVRVFACDHPYPSARNEVAASEAAALVDRITPGEVLVVLLSGGASAYLSAPAPGLTLDDLRDATRRLQLAGATIGELNAVRKHAETLKGGRLAARCRGRCEVLVLSDVMGDRLEAIGSGPFAADPTTFADAAAVLDRHGLGDLAVGGYLRRARDERFEETVKPGHPALARVGHTIVSSNAVVLGAAAARLRDAGVREVHVEAGVEGEARVIGERLARRLRAHADSGARPAAWVIGGEWTVRVGEAAGEGGPSQELALAAAVALEGAPGVSVLAYSTDGVDGPTDAAGAIVDGDSAGAVRRAGVEPATALAAHDSRGALGSAGLLIRTGPTGTNVNHVAVGLAWGHGCAGG